MIAVHEEINMIELLKFGRLDRLRILMGAPWCDCGCGLMERQPYSVLRDTCHLPYGTLHKLTGTARVYLTEEKLEGLVRISRVSREKVLNVLNIRSSVESNTYPTKRE